MYPYRINLFLAVALVMLGLWSIQASGRDNHTLIVPALGILLSFFHRPLLNAPERFFKIVIALTGIIFLTLLLPLKNSLESGHQMGTLRVALMLICTAAALVMYYKIWRLQKSL